MVSIIINNYNYGRYIGDAIESAITQTYPETEVIVVDDGSTDHSRDIIKQFETNIITVLKKNAGQASCFNAGFKVCKGDVIIFLDADDYLDKTAAEKAVAAFSNDNIVKVHWPLWKVDHEKKLSGKTVPDDTLVEGNLRQQIIEFGPGKCGGPPNSPPTSGNAWSRKFLKNVLPVPEEIFRLGADHYLFLLAPLFGEIKSIQQPLGFYRVHGTNDTLRSDYLETFFNRYEEGCTILSQFLQKQGINIDPASWPRDHWYHQVYADMNVIAQLIPADKSFILIDEDHWSAGNRVMGRKRMYFSEKEGQYWGPPSNDEAAIEELEKDRVLGASHVVFTWPAFWWLEYYKGFHSHLQSHFPCVLQTDRLIVYQLSPNGKTS